VLACRGGHRSNGIAVFGHVEENCDCYHLFPEVPSYFFKDAGQLHGHAMPGSEPKLVVSH